MLLDGRMEKRVPLDVQARLGSNEQSLAAERAITVNVGPRGARAIARRVSWRAEERPWPAPLSNEFRLQARVIYCQALTTRYFCVGLRFEAGFTHFGDHPSLGFHDKTSTLSRKIKEGQTRRRAALRCPEGTRAIS